MPAASKIIQKHYYTARADHVSYRNASHYDNNEALPLEDGEQSFDHQLSDEEIAQHFPNVKAPE